MDRRAGRRRDCAAGVGGGGPAVPVPAGSVPPAEQDRLIAAERRAEQAGAEYPASALDSDRGPVR